MDNKDVVINEDYGQIFNADAIMKIKVTKDNAKADGDDSVKVNVTFDNVDDSLTDIRVDYTILSGNAVFKENNKKTIVKHTNSALSSTVLLVDMIPGSGTIKAVPYFNPTAAPDPVTYNFIAQAIKLSLSITKDNSPADGSDFDVVVATLINDEGKGIADQTLNFSLPNGGTSYFKDSGQINYSDTTDQNGRCEVHIFDNGKQDNSVTLRCSLLSDPNVTQNIDVHFKRKVLLPNFQLVGLVTKGVAGDRKPGQVRAIITPDASSMPTDYIVKFSKYGSNEFKSPYFSTISLPGVLSGIDGEVELSVPVNVSDKTNVDAWVHYLDDQPGTAHIQAELQTRTRKHIAYSDTASNPLIVFDAPVSPPPPTHSYLPKIKVSYHIWSDMALNNSVYACVLYIDYINGYMPPERLIIQSLSDRLRVAEAIGNFRPNMVVSCNFSTNFFNRGRGVVYARDLTFNTEKSNDERYFQILDGKNIIWKGYLTFITASVVDCTDKT